MAARSNIPIAERLIRDAEWRSAYCIDEGGAVLVRPDGYVAARWRSGPTDAGVELTNALAAVLRRGVRVGVGTGDYRDED